MPPFVFVEFFIDSGGSSYCKAMPELGLQTYGSPTTSNQAVIPYTSLKIGPGDSARSHTANEYIALDEIEEGIRIFVELLDGFQFKI